MFSESKKVYFKILKQKFKISIFRFSLQIYQKSFNGTSSDFSQFKFWHFQTEDVFLKYTDWDIWSLTTFF